MRFLENPPGENLIMEMGRNCISLSIGIRISIGSNGIMAPEIASGSAAYFCNSTHNGVAGGNYASSVGGCAPVFCVA
jgi:hypothetical protein